MIHFGYSIIKWHMQKYFTYSNQLSAYFYHFTLSISQCFIMLFLCTNVKQKSMCYYKI